MLWLKDSPSEKRVIKHLERAIKDKLFKAGLDTGGRQIEVKFITTSIPSEVKIKQFKISLWSSTLMYNFDF